MTSLMDLGVAVATGYLVINVFFTVTLLGSVWAVVTWRDL